MPNFEYKAANAKGEASLGVIEAPDIDAALARLRASGLYPWGVVPTDEPVPERPKPEPVKPIDDGGPAFPHPEIVMGITDESGALNGHRVYPAYPGMSLRAWLAGQALASVGSLPGPDIQETADLACALADAVIAALANKR